MNLIARERSLMKRFALEAIIQVARSLGTKHIQKWYWQIGVFLMQLPRKDLQGTRWTRIYFSKGRETATTMVH